MILRGEDIFNELYKAVIQDKSKEKSIKKFIDKYCNKTMFAHSFYIYSDDYKISSANSHLLPVTKVILEEKEVHKCVEENSKLTSWRAISSPSDFLETLKVNFTKLDKNDKKLKSKISLWKKVPKGSFYGKKYSFIDLTFDEETARNILFQKVLEHNTNYVEDVVKNITNYLEVLKLPIDPKTVQKQIVKKVMEDLF